jgi:hypothetical protein
MTTETTFPPDDGRSHSHDFSGDTFRRNLDVVADRHFCGQPRHSMAAACRRVDHPQSGRRRRDRRRVSSRAGRALTPAADVELTAEELDPDRRDLAHAAPVAGPARKDVTACRRSPSRAFANRSRGWRPAWLTPAMAAPCGAEPRLRERTTASVTSARLPFQRSAFWRRFRLAGTEDGGPSGVYAGAGHDDIGPLPRDPRRQASAQTRTTGG